MSDLISRQDTIDRINEYIEEYSEIDSDGNHSEKWCAMQEAKMTIENMPSAQPERKHGYWVESQEHVYMGNSVKEWTNWYCSECDAPNDKPSDFCPSCGADMRGE